MDGPACPPQQAKALAGDPGVAVVLDRFSRRIVGWAMGDAITAELACRALDMAWPSRRPAPGLIFHSDRGSQYAGRCYTDLLAMKSCLP